MHLSSHANKAKSAKIPLTERFPASYPPDTRAKVLLLIVDGKYGAAWADDPHQEFIEQLLETFNVYASTPASAVIDVQHKKADIVLIIGADTMHKTCDRAGTVTHLNSFAKTGGLIIFCGVPWGLYEGFGFDEEDKDDAIFQNLFGLSWTVGETMASWNKRVPNSPLMPTQRVKIAGTYLTNVDKEAALYRVCVNALGAKPAKDAQTAVAYEAFGDGYVGYVGFEDMFTEEAMEILAALMDADALMDK